MTADCVYLPPTVFMCSPFINTASYDETLERYIVQLTALHERLASKLIRLLVSKNAADILVEANCYPVFPSIRDGLARANLDETYQTGDVVRIIDQLLRGVDTIESEIDIADFLADQICIHSPITFVGGHNAHERQQYPLVKLALGQFLTLFPAGRTWIVGQLVNSSGNTTQVSAVIQDIEWINLPRNLELPLNIDEQFPCRGDISQVLRGLELSVLNVDLTRECMTELISIALLQSEYIGNHTPRFEWSIGSQFCESVTRVHLDNNPIVMRSLLQACVSVICGISMDKTHPLRTGSGGNSPQITRMGATAWRRDVDYEFHLHYWCVDNRYVFASCGTHNCFSIPAPD